jgi:L-alanine-DL-glutamate epimerase-like enolase superfamily enzyme
MRIKDIQTAVIEANYDWTLVKILTDEGAVGYGECFFAPGLTTLIRELRPLLLGQDTVEIERLGRIMRTAGVAAGLLGGIVNNACAGIESALWDLLGQSLGVPPSTGFLGVAIGPGSASTQTATPGRGSRAYLQ